MTNETLEKQPDTDGWQTIEERIAYWRNRSPEEIERTRARIIKPGRPLPPGKTLEDVFVGAIKDDLTEEEVLAALAEIE